MITLSEDQKVCFDTLVSWYKNPVDFMTLAGYAGTGKSSLIAWFRNFLPETTRIFFCAYTGKAASVLRSKLVKFGINRFPNDTCGTIHSTIYQPKVKDDEIDGWVLKQQLECDLIIVDEASMISEDIFKDLKSFNKPILFVGDHGQLPPIEGLLNLMENPIIKLEKVHRFAEQNPLTKISMMARLDGYIPPGWHGDTVVKVPPKHPLITKFINDSGDFSNTAILCGFNNTRVDLNKKIREWKGYKGSLPQVGERLICLKNNKNAKKCPIYNGILGTAKYIEPYYNYVKLRVEVDGEHDHYKGKASKIVFNNAKPILNEFVYSSDDVESDGEDDSVDNMMNRFNSRSRGKRKSQKIYLDAWDFGYCTTVHKSQGSEWDRVMVIEQNCDFWSGPKWNKWLYTAVTRAKNELLIVR